MGSWSKSFKYCNLPSNIFTFSTVLLILHLLISLLFFTMMLIIYIQRFWLFFTVLVIHTGERAINFSTICLFHRHSILITHWVFKRNLNLIFLVNLNILIMKLSYTLQCLKSIVPRFDNFQTPATPKIWYSTCEGSVAQWNPDTSAFM